jgi:hypothetical protein
MTLDLGLCDVMITKYLIIILITYKKMITCHMSMMQKCYIIIWLYSPIILHE